MKPHCIYQKKNKEQCRNFALDGKKFCYYHYHVPYLRLRRWIKDNVINVIGVIIGVIGIIGIIPPLYLYCTSPIQLPFEKLKDEKIKYYEGKEIKKAREINNEIIQKIFSDINAEDIIMIGVREGIDYFVIFYDSEYLMGKIAIYRERAEANMEPLKALIPYQVHYARYERIFRDYESAIVIWVSEGSGNFLTIHVIIYSGQEYTDLAKKIGPDFPDATFAFADLDADGWKELIIAHGRKAFKPSKQYFKLNTKNLLYVEIDPNDPLYKELEKKVEEIKDKEKIEDIESFEEGVR
jgi:hypothetical protein